MVRKGPGLIGKERQAIGGSVTLKAKAEEATEGRLEIHTKQMVIN